MNRENICLQQRRGRPKLFGEAVLDETGNRIVKTVGKTRAECRPGRATAVAIANVRRKSVGVSPRLAFP